MAFLQMQKNQENEKCLVPCFSKRTIIKVFKNTKKKLERNVFFFRNACQVEFVPRQVRHFSSAEKVNVVKRLVFINFKTIWSFLLQIIFVFVFFKGLFLIFNISNVYITNMYLFWIIVKSRYQSDDFYDCNQLNRS